MLHVFVDVAFSSELLTNTHIHTSKYERVNKRKGRMHVIFCTSILEAPTIKLWCDLTKGEYIEKKIK